MKLVADRFAKPSLLTNQEQNCSHTTPFSLLNAYRATKPCRLALIDSDPQ
jgi:hypothetical protein